MRSESAAAGIKRLTYVDSGVLIAAARGSGPVSERALRELSDPAREFARSEYVRLEIMPKAVFHRSTLEIAIYEGFFACVVAWADPAAVVGLAYTAACLAGLNAVDALHVAAAQAVGATELLTTERASSPLHRTALIPVVSLRGET